MARIRRSVLSEPRSAGESQPASRAHQRARALVALLVASLVAVFAAVRMTAPGRAAGSDLGLQLLASRAFWKGHDPYSQVGPGRAVEAQAPPFYPATTLAAVGPLAVLPDWMAVVVFTALVAGTFAFCVTKRSFVPLAAVLSWPFFSAADSPQWSPLLAAAAATPGLAWAVVLKPNVGLAAAAYRPTGAWLLSALVGGLLLMLVSLTRQPDWPAAWYGALHARALAPHLGARVPTDLYVQPGTFAGGWLALLALLRWRRPEARLLAVLAFLPQIPTGYELVPVLALVPRTRVEGLALALASWAMPFLMFSGPSHPDLRSALEAYAAWSVWCVFLPALALVLRRPNEGEIPDRLERLMAVVRIPTWLRGRAPALRPRGTPGFRSEP